LADIAIGFRRDEAAVQIATKGLKFSMNNRVSEIELSAGFSIFMEELRNKEIEQEKIKDDFSDLNLLSRLKSKESFNKNNQ